MVLGRLGPLGAPHTCLCEETAGGGAGAVLTSATAFWRARSAHGTSHNQRTTKTTGELSTTTHIHKQPPCAEKQKVICAIDGNNNHAFYIIRGNTCHIASIDSKGRVACTPTVTSTLDPDTTYPAVRWGAGYKGPTVTSYPLPSEFSFEGQATPLDRLTVKHLTLLFTAHVHKPPSCLTSWPRRLRVQALATRIPTATVSDGRRSATIATPVSVHRNSIPTLAPLTQHFRNTGLLSFKDWHLYFKHILHRALSTRHRRGEARTVCRLCHRERESCAHLGRCRMIAHLFSRMKLILPDTPAPSRDRILFCYVVWRTNVSP